MKRLATLAVVLILIFSFSMSALAMEVPTEAEVRNLNGVQQYVKTYTVRPDTDPRELIDEPFDYDGFTYSYASIIKAENRFADKLEHTEIVTVETAKKDLATVLAELPVSVEYDDGRYTGTLYLDHNTIETAAAGYTKKSYTCTTTKEYENLPTNDMSYIASTATKDGYTLPLANVEWTTQSTALVDDVLVPTTYKAVATYSDKVSYSSATGYITTAEYFGTITISKANPKARKYVPLPLECDLVSYGNNIVAQVSERTKSAVEKYINKFDVYRCFETPQINMLNDLRAPFDLKVCFMAEYFLPDVTKIKELDCGYELRVLHQKDFAGLYTEQWSNCLTFHDRERDVLAVGAYDNGMLIGLAGCSADCEMMYQIGVDVLPEYRRKGVASAVTSKLALEILALGKVPFYCAAWSNIRSVRNAGKSGFCPAWVELTARDTEFVNGMIK